MVEDLELFAQRGHSSWHVTVHRESDEDIAARDATRCWKTKDNFGLLLFVRAMVVKEVTLVCQVPGEHSQSQLRKVVRRHRQSALSVQSLLRTLTLLLQAESLHAFRKGFWFKLNGDVSLQGADIVIVDKIQGREASDSCFRYDRLDAGLHCLHQSLQDGICTVRWRNLAEELANLSFPANRIERRQLPRTAA
jgi:hypothetical protein